MKTPLLILGTSVLVSCTTAEKPESDGGIRSASVDTVLYEPAITSLTGVLSTEQAYGPPNFGETRNVDQVLNVVILRLQQPIVVFGAETADVNIDTFNNVTEIQLIGVPDRFLAESAGQQVSVRGTLFQRVSGFHKRDVLMTVSLIEPEPRR